MPFPHFLISFKICAFFGSLFALFLVVAVKVLACYDLLHPAQKQTCSSYF